MLRMGKKEGFKNKEKSLCHDAWLKDKQDQMLLDPTCTFLTLWGCAFCAGSFCAQISLEKIWIELGQAGLLHPRKRAGLSWELCGGQNGAIGIQVSRDCHFPPAIWEADEQAENSSAKFSNVFIAFTCKSFSNEAKYSKRKRKKQPPWCRLRTYRLFYQDAKFAWKGPPMRELLKITNPHQELNMTADDLFYMSDDQLVLQFVYLTFHIVLLGGSYLLCVLLIVLALVFLWGCCWQGKLLAETVTQCQKVQRDLWAGQPNTTGLGSLASTTFLVEQEIYKKSDSDLLQ